VRTRHRGSGSGSPRATRPESGTSYLLRRRDELAAPPDQGGRDAFTAVDALVRSFGAVPGELRDDGNAGQSRSYLVPDAVVAELSAALEPLCDRWAARGTDVELSGPLPAYSFADVRLGAAS
jgi:hypothetical protein